MFTHFVFPTKILCLTAANYFVTLFKHFSILVLGFAFKCELSPGRIEKADSPLKWTSNFASDRKRQAFKAWKSSLARPEPGNDKSPLICLILRPPFLHGRCHPYLLERIQCGCQHHSERGAPSRDFIAGADISSEVGIFWPCMRLEVLAEAKM